MDEDEVSARGEVAGPDVGHQQLAVPKGGAQVFRVLCWEAFHL